MESGTRTRRNRHLGAACLPIASSPRVWVGEWWALEVLPLSPLLLYFRQRFYRPPRRAAPGLESVVKRRRSRATSKRHLRLPISLSIEGKRKLLPALLLSALRASAESSRSHTLNNSGGRALVVGMHRSVSCACISHTSRASATTDARVACATVLRPYTDGIRPASSGSPTMRVRALRSFCRA